MKIKILHSLQTIFALMIATLSSPVLAAEWSGYVGAQSRNFIEEPLDPEQHNNYLSVAAEPNFYHSWDEDSKSVEIELFYRKDQHDDQRTHGDIRELSWTSIYEDWELLVGISKVYWGVAETQHLVDIVNQTDFVENVDGEDKLGQPMIKASTERDWGVIDVFILPGFRERTFAGLEGRPRPNIVVNTNADAIYDFSAGKEHIDIALRYSHYIDEFEFGISLFSGVDREPSNFKPVAYSNTGEPTVVIPVYSQINQLGVDGQAFFGDWTWKLEAVHIEVRSGDKKGTKSFKTVGGFEYTLVGIFESQMDLGFVIEYHYSDQNIRPTTFDNDLATALRFVFNDAQTSEILAGIITDADTQSIASFVEGTRRLADSWTIKAEIRAFHGAKQNQPLFSFRFDDFAQVDLNYNF